MSLEIHVFRKMFIPKAAHKSHQLKKKIKNPKQAKQNNTRQTQIQTNPHFFQHKFLAITKM